MTLAAVVASLAGAPAALAADGDLDARFDYDGVRTYDCGFASTAQTAGRDMAVQPDGKVVVLIHGPQGSFSGCVARFTTTGAFDQAFGDTAKTLLSGIDPTAVALAPDGGILVTGESDAGDAVVVRLDADGHPDPAFGTGGTARFRFADARPSRPLALAVQADGGIVVAGVESEDSATHAGVARLTAAGALDPTFSGDGRTVESFSPVLDVASSIVLQGPRIVLVGSAEAVTPGATDSFVATALASDGTRDSSFGPSGTGRVAVALGPDSAAYDGILTPDGGLLLTGDVAEEGGVHRGGVLKLDAGGRPDPGFSGDGAALLDFGAHSSAHAAAVTIDGKYAIAGGAAQSPDPDASTMLAVAKLTPAGALDPSFGDGGRRIYDGVPVAARAIARQADGKLLASGAGSDGTSAARIDDSLPVATLSGGTASEGHAVPFTVSLSKTSGFPASFDFVTGEGSALRGVDYTGHHGTLTVSAGHLSATIGIPALLDRVFEPDEHFRVEVSDPVNAVLARRIDGGTIRNVLRRGRCANLVPGNGGEGGLIEGSRAGDRIVGGKRGDVLTGLAGDDCLLGLGDDDVLVGGHGADLLDGGAGDDSLDGGHGNDRLFGGRGFNHYSGGTGNDVIEARNGHAETIDCGRGRDRVNADRSDRLRRCERVSRG